jgi:hypothetical protein
MPDVRMPNGIVIRGVPEGITKDDLLSKLASNGYDTKALLTPPAAGFTGAFSEAVRTLGLADEATAFAASPTSETRKAFLDAARSKYRSVGFGEGENWEALKELAGSSLGMLAAPAAAGLGVGLVTTPIGGTIAAGGVSEAQYTIQNLQRQAEEQQKAVEAGQTPDPVSIGKAVVAATGQTALDFAAGPVFGKISKLFPFMRPLLGKAGTEANEKATEVFADAIANGKLKFAKDVAKGVGKGVAFEVPQEIAQQGLERWQAGLSLTDDDAFNEYTQAAIGAAILGGGFGALEGAIPGTRAGEEKGAPYSGAIDESIPEGFKQQDIAKRLRAHIKDGVEYATESRIQSISRVLNNGLLNGTPEGIATASEQIKGYRDRFDAGQVNVTDEDAAAYDTALKEAESILEDFRKKHLAVKSAEPTTAVKTAAPAEPTTAVKTAAPAEPTTAVKTAAPAEPTTAVKTAAPAEPTTTIVGAPGEPQSIPAQAAPALAPSDGRGVSGTPVDVAGGSEPSIPPVGGPGETGPGVAAPAVPEGVGEGVVTSGPSAGVPAVGEAVQPSPLIDLKPVYDAKDAKTRKAAARSIVDGFVESLVPEGTTISAPVRNQIAGQIAQTIKKGEVPDPQQIARNVLAEKKIPLKEKAPAPEAVKPEEAPAPEAVKPEEAPAPEAVKPEEAPAPEAVKPEEAPAPEAVKPEEEPAPEAVKPEEAPAPEAVKPEEEPIYPTGLLPETSRRPVIPFALSKDEEKLGKDAANKLKGTLVFQLGDMGLVRRFNRVSGDVKYLAFVGKKIYRTDVDNLMHLPVGDLHTLRNEKQNDILSRVKSATGPDAPFANYDANGNYFSDGVPDALRGVIAGWKKLLGINYNIYFSTFDDALSTGSSYFGPRIVKVSATVGGVSVKYKDGKRAILFHTDGAFTNILETIAHELGHVHQDLAYENAPQELKSRLYDAYLQWKKETISPDSTARGVVEALRAKSVGERTRIPADLLFKNVRLHQQEYLTSFNEWYADQVSRWAVSDAKPVGVVEAFFKAVGAALRKFFRSPEVRRYLPNETFVQYLDAVRQSASNAVEASVTPNAPEISALKIDSLEALAKPINPQEFVAAHDLVRKFSNRFADAQTIVDYFKRVSGITNLPERFNLARKFEFYPTKKNAAQRLIERNFELPLLELIKKEGLSLQDVAIYLLSRAAPARNRKIAAVNAEFGEGGSGMLTAEAEANLKGLKARGLWDKLEKVGRLHDALVDHMLEMRVRAGLSSQGEVDELRKAEPKYTPFKGFAKDGDFTTSGLDTESDVESTRKTVSGLKRGVPMREFFKAMGRKSLPFHPLFNLFADAEALTRRVAMNEVYKTFVNMYDSNPEGMGEFVEGIYSDKRPKVAHKPSAVDPAGELVRVPMHLQVLSNPAQFAVVKIGGKNRYIEFSDTDAGRAAKRLFANLRPEQMTDVMKNVTRINNALKGLLTYRNPLYLALVAPFRDTLDAVATALHNQNVKGTPAFKKNLALKVAAYSAQPTMWRTVTRYVMGRQPLPGQEGLVRVLEDMLRNGGAPMQISFKTAQEQANAAGAELERIARAQRGAPLAIGGETIAGIGRFFDHWAEINDIVPRFATYRAAVEAKISPEESASLALDSSLNLTRRGEASVLMDNILPFFSANIEGSRKVLRIARNPRSVAKVIGGTIAVGILESLANASFGGDGDDDGIPDYLQVDRMRRVSRLNLHFGSGDASVSIPIGQMLGYFKFVGNKIADTWLGVTSGEAAGMALQDAGFEVAKELFSLLSPARLQGGDIQSTLSSLVPLIGKPIVDVARNENFFGSPIYTEKREGMGPRSEIGRAATADFWKGVARSVNHVTGGSAATSGFADIQPEVYQYMMENYLGGAARLFKQAYQFAEEPGIKKAPVLRGLMGEGAEYVAQNNYRKNTEIIRDVVSQIDRLSPEEFQSIQEDNPVALSPRVFSVYQVVEPAVQKLYRERKQLLDIVKDADDRKKVLDYYKGEMDSLWSAFNRVYEQERRKQR